MHKAGWNIATSQRRDVGSTRIKVNKWQRRDVSTSRRCNVITSARVFVSPSLKAKGDQNSRHRRSYELGHRNQSSRTLTLKKGPTFVFYFFWIKVLMFYRLNICVLTFSMF